MEVGRKHRARVWGSPGSKTPLSTSDLEVTAALPPRIRHGRCRSGPPPPSRLEGEEPGAPEVEDNPEESLREAREGLRAQSPALRASELRVRRLQTRARLHPQPCFARSLDALPGEDRRTLQGSRTLWERHLCGAKTKAGGGRRLLRVPEGGQPIPLEREPGAPRLAWAPGRCKTISATNQVSQHSLTALGTSTELSARPSPDAAHGAHLALRGAGPDRPQQQEHRASCLQRAPRSVHMVHTARPPGARPGDQAEAQPRPTSGQGQKQRGGRAPRV